MSARNAWRKFAKKALTLIGLGFNPLHPDVLVEAPTKNLNKAIRIARREEKRSLRRKTQKIVTSVTVTTSTVVETKAELSEPAQTLETLVQKATRDELRKAFTYAGIKGFRNATRAEFEECCHKLNTGLLFNVGDLMFCDEEANIRYRDMVRSYLAGKTETRIGK